MNKCVVCGNDSGKGKTCSNTCRSKLARSVASTVAKLTVALSVATPNNQVEQLSRKQLKAAIDSYPEDTWKDSLEYRELIHRLHTKSVDELKAEGYWIPAWKVKVA